MNLDDFGQIAARRHDAERDTRRSSIHVFILDGIG
jgi:hypothetical protein